MRDGGELLNYLVRDPDAFARNLAGALDSWRRAAATAGNPGPGGADLLADELAVASRTFASVAAGSREETRNSIAFQPSASEMPPAAEARIWPPASALFICCFGEGPLPEPSSGRTVPQ